VGAGARGSGAYHTQAIEVLKMLIVFSMIFGDPSLLKYASKAEHIYAGNVKGITF